MVGAQWRLLCRPGGKRTVDPMTERTTPERCDRCGGDPTTRDEAGVAVVECADCGNVLGLAEASSPDPGGLRTGAVRAADGDLGQLVALLRAEADGPGGTLGAERLLLETATATLEVTAADGRIEIRELGTGASGSRG